LAKIASEQITETVSELFIDANCHIREEVFNAWLKALKEEKEGGLAGEIYKIMIKNAWIAWRDSIPICQDTGQPVVFIEQGDGVEIVGRPLFDAINEGINKGGRDGFLRKSVMQDPLDRDNEGGYGPPLIHHRMVKGNLVKITLYPAGCGCEQMNRTMMFPPCNAEETIKRFVIERVKEAGSKPCPPTILGVGIGGDLEVCSYLARRALLRPFNKGNKEYETLERSLLKQINNLGIGPLGLGGKTTAMALNIETAPCHRGNLPLSIAFNCHIGRRSETVLGLSKEEGPDAKTQKTILRERLQQMAEGIKPFQGWKSLELPLTDSLISNLKTGDRLLLTGAVYTARDAAHRRLANSIKEKKELPFPLKGQVIYYVGPTPPVPGQVIGSAGPTTSARMDSYTPLLLAHGLRGMIGKGYRSKEVTDAIKEYKGIYFITFSGAGALLSKCIRKSEMICFEELGAEAIRRFELKDFPAIVATDAWGNDIYRRL